MLLLMCRKADEAFDKPSERTTIDSRIPPKLSIQYGSLRTSAPISAINTAMLINPSARWWAALEASTGDLWTFAAFDASHELLVSGFG